MSASKNWFATTVILVASCVGAYFGVKYAMNQMAVVSTDNASVTGHVYMLSFQIPGKVTQILVTENERVNKGQLIATIDDSEYQLKVAQAEAELAAHNVRLGELNSSYRRIASLFESQAATKQQLELAEAGYNEMNERLKAKQSFIEQSKLHIAYSKLYAPADGVVGKKAIEPGLYVRPGQPVVGMVGSEERWIVANFKETEIAGLKPGMPVSIKIDAIEDKQFEGEIESIGNSTGSTFSLLPPDNATGNFTKVTQRIPARIKFKNLKEEDISRLHLGLSAIVAVRIKP